MHQSNRMGAMIVAAMLGCTTASITPSVNAQNAIENKEVAAALTEAQKLAAKKQWKAALVAIDKAQAVPSKSAYADYKLDEYKAYLLIQQRQYADAAAVYERLANSPQASGAASNTHLKTAAQLYMQAKQNSKAADVAQRALKRQPNDLQLLELAGQAQYVAQNYKGAANTMQQLVRLTEKQGKKPEETWLQIVLNSYYELDNQDGIAQSWESLLRHYPKSQYWEKVLQFKTAGVQTPAIELGYQRLMFDVGVMKDPDDYEDLAMSAIDAGAPAEAVRVLEEGLQSGKLKGPNEDRFKRMLQHAQNAVAKSQANLAALQREAQQATTGQPTIELGRAYLAQGQHDQAIAAFEAGIKKGQLTNADEARLELGIAYMKRDQAKRAQQTFAAVKSNEQWRDLAELWHLHSMTASTSQ